MPASPHSNLLGGVWIRTATAGTLAFATTPAESGGRTAVVDVSGRLDTAAGPLSADQLNGSAPTGRAEAAGVPAATTDRINAAVVLMRCVVVISTCLLWFVDRPVRSVRRRRCARLVKERSIPVNNR
jgi:hypothetical protein